MAKLSLSIFTSITLINYTKGNVKSLQKLIDQYSVGPRNQNLTRGLSDSYNGFGNIDKITNYGCWCNLDNPRGFGEPVDEIDALCKTLVEAYRCAKIDEEQQNVGIEEARICEAWTEEYNSQVAIIQDATYSQCQISNPDNSCAAKACSIEGYFVENLFVLFFQNIKPVTELFSHENFDWQSECKVHNSKSRNT